MQDTAVRPGLSTGAKVGIGCAAGCLVLVVVLLVAGGILGKRAFQALGEMGQVCDGFVRAGLSDNPAAAYDMLHPGLQQTHPKELFVAEWTALRGNVGTLQSIQPGPPAPDLQQGTVKLPLTAIGDQGRLEISVTVNPNDTPVRVLGYSLNLTTGGGAASAGSPEPTPAPAPN